MILGTVRELWRYPVKSMGGEQLHAADVTDRGIGGDRRRALLDLETGKIASAKHPRLWGELLRCRARIVSPTGAVCIALPDGRQVTCGQDDIDAALSVLSGRAVKLVDTPPANPEIDRYWPDVEGLALRDIVTTNEIGQGAPFGSFFDYAPLHLLTMATLRTLSRLYPSGQIDVRRFRPNVLIQTPDEMGGFVENGWVGCTISIGHGLRLRVTDPTPRCVVPTLPQDHLASEIGILRAIAKHNRPAVPALADAQLPCLGVYAVVERGGTVAVSDTVRVTDAG